MIQMWNVFSEHYVLQFSAYGLSKEIYYAQTEIQSAKNKSLSGQSV